MKGIHIQNEIPSLFEYYSDYFKVGAALNHFAFLHENVESELVKKHFNLIAAENATKMDNIFLSENNFNFSIADKFLDFGKINQKNIHWHTLLWHKQNPSWIFIKNNSQADFQNSVISKEELNLRLKKYIQTVSDYTKDCVSSYDVVTEILSDKNGNLRNSKEGSLWQEILGDSYIENAFNWCHEANPKADLILNESNLIQNKIKRQSLYDYAEILVSKKIPVSTIGLQLHIDMNNPSIEEIENTIMLYGKLGLKVAITSLDISFYNNDSETKKDYSKDMLNKQAQRYFELFECFKRTAQKGILTKVIFWGVSDKTSWKNDNPVEKRTDAPLLFDRNGLAKPAFFAVTK